MQKNMNIKRSQTCFAQKSDQARTFPQLRHFALWHMSRDNASVGRYRAYIRSCQNFFATVYVSFVYFLRRPRKKSERFRTPELRSDPVKARGPAKPGSRSSPKKLNPGFPHSETPAPPPTTRGRPASAFSSLVK